MDMDIHPDMSKTWEDSGARGRKRRARHEGELPDREKDGLW